jgi:hypothetical protein
MKCQSVGLHIEATLAYQWDWKQRVAVDVGSACRICNDVQHIVLQSVLATLSDR